MSNSPLVTYTKRVTHYSRPREHKIDTITIHHMAGNASVETCADVLQSRNCSANYGIGTDGRIALYVDEANRSWASFSPSNDHRAVTIEVANCGGEPDWPVSDKAYAALIDLCADICRRNGIRRLVWGESKDDRVNHRNGCNMTVHRDFMATACPGPYLLRKMPQIARDVNEKLGAAEPAAGAHSAPYLVRVSCNGPIHAAPSAAAKQRGTIRPGVYTIVQESDGWGRLKSGAGWIALDGVSLL